MAADKLGRANAAATGHHKHDAMRLAQQAQVDANLARAKSESTQARIAAAELTKTNQTHARQSTAQTRTSRGER